jgi:SAM-dependent methyltransferase
MIDASSRTVSRHAHRLRRGLSARTAPEPYLAEVARREPSHRFLGNSAQAIYVRQVALLSRLLESQTSRPPEEIDVLDWGCGKGHISYLLNKHRFRVVSCDLAAGADDSAFGQRTPINRECGHDVIALEDAVKLPFDDASFDCVTSFGVLEHVQDDLGSMHEIRRVLRQDGVFYVTFLPYFMSWTHAVMKRWGSAYHDRLYTQRTVRELAHSAGFTVQAMWLAQLFPKNSVPHAADAVLEPIDRELCKYTPLRFFATNLEIVMTAA